MRFLSLAPGRFLLPVATMLAAVAVPAQAGGTPPVVRPAPPRLLAQFDVGAGTVQSLDLLSDAGPVGIPIMLGSDLRTMDLILHDVRGPNFQLLVEGANGTQNVPTPACVTYRGTLREEISTGIVATVIGGSLTALIYRDPQALGTPRETWVVQPIRQVSAQAGPQAHIVYRSSDSTQLPFTCATPPSPQPLAPQPQAGVDTLICDIAIEADVQFWQANNSNATTTQNDITGVMNNVDFIYNRDCGVQFNVTTILVSTTTIYTTNDASTLLSQFGANWSSTHSGITRDVAHLFTGRNLSGSTIGIAWLSGICSSGQGYGLSQSRFTSNMNRRVGLTAHEIGHNFSAPHCSGSGCYIMCPSLGGCGGNVTLFSTAAQTQIANYAATRGCLSSGLSLPVLTSLSPSTVKVFLPGSVQVSGSGLTGVTSFSIGSQSFSSGFNVLNDGALAISMPYGTVLGPTTLSVTGPLGTSNTLPVSYAVTAPPRLLTTPSISSSGGVAQFDFGGQPSELWFLVLAPAYAVTPFQGFDLLSNSILLSAGVFSQPLGIEQYIIPVPGGLGFQLVYSQIFQASTVTLTGTGVSNAGATVLL